MLTEIASKIKPQEDGKDNKIPSAHNRILLHCPDITLKGKKPG